jgi:hypothetical protein
LALEFAIDLTFLVKDLKLTFRFAIINLFLKLLNVVTGLLSFFGKAILLLLEVLTDLFDFSVEFVLFALEVIELLKLKDRLVDEALELNAEIKKISEDLKKKQDSLPKKLRSPVTTFKSLRNRLMIAKRKVSFRSFTRKVRSMANSSANRDSTA